MASGSGWNLCLWLVGVVVRRCIDFLILFIPTLVPALFCSQHPYFLFIFKNVFRSLNIIMGHMRVIIIIRHSECHLNVTCMYWYLTPHEYNMILCYYYILALAMHSGVTQSGRNSV